MTRLIRTAALCAASLLLGCGGSNGSADDAQNARNQSSGTAVDGNAPPEKALVALAPLPTGASLDERLDRARQITDRLRVRSDRVQRSLRDARRAQYGLQTSCLDDLLSQLHAAERDGMAATKAVRAAASKEDARTVDREVSRLMVLEERSRILVHTARSCGQVKRRTPPASAGL
jgi:hypothetical protein